MSNKELIVAEQIKGQVRVKDIETIITAEYGEDVFKTLPINRTLKPANIQRLVKAFRGVHPCGVSVLTVIRTTAWDGIKVDYLCDGHNRRKAALKFSSEIGCAVPLKFNIIEIDGEDSIQNVGKILETINVNLGTWSPKDFTSHIAKLGLTMSKDYQEFAELSEKHALGESTMLEILGLGKFTMAQYKAKEFRITNRAKSNAILNVIHKIGFNDPKQDIDNAFPHNYIKRTLIKQLISLDLDEVKGATAKFKVWLRDNKFSYDEQIFRKELEEIFTPVEVE
jgi:hypothetical protein